MKFNNVPVEPDTRIIQQREIEIEGVPALHQTWSWDGLIGESIIFHSDDVEGFTDDEIFELINDHTDPEGKYTVSRSDSGYTFVNFNFRY